MLTQFSDPGLLRKSVLRVLVMSMPTPASLKKLEKDLLRVLDGLDRADERNQSIYAANRDFQRKALRIPLRLLPAGIAEPHPDQETIGYSREVSRSGISFVTLTRYSTQEVVIGMPAPNGEMNWMRGEVKRSRELPDGFWEYGVAFTGKANVTFRS